MFKSRRPTEILPSSKERFPKNIYLHNSLARYRAFFDNRTISISEFSSCVTTGGRLCQSCSVLQNDSSRDFQHSKQCKYKEKYLSKFSKAHKRKQTLSSGKSELQMFFSYFRPPCWCPSEGHHHGVSIQSSINLCGILCQITRVRKTVQT